MMFSSIIMNKIFDEIENDKSDERGHKEVFRERFMDNTEIKHIVFFTTYGEEFILRKI